LKMSYLLIVFYEGTICCCYCCWYGLYGFLGGPFLGVDCFWK